MKLACVAVCCFGVALCSAGSLKDKDVPAPVMSSFQQSYPKAEDAEWTKEKGNFEVSFEVNDTEMSAVLTGGGTIVEKSTKVDASALPAALTDAFTSNYPGFFVKEAEMVEKDVPKAVIAAFQSAYPQAAISSIEKCDKGGRVLYKIEMKTGGAESEVLYTPEGTVSSVISEEKGKKDDNEKGEKDDDKDGGEKEDKD